MELVIKPFEELTAEELFALYKLRTAVFVVEQKCPYQEVDDADKEALHLWLREEDGSAAACLRLLPGEHPGEAVIGRVVSARRGQGLGARILRAGIDAARERLGAETVTLAAQTYARGFYEKAGFEATSGEFLEDGIPHIKMTLRINQSEINLSDTAAPAFVLRRALPEDYPAVRALIRMECDLHRQARPDQFREADYPRAEYEELLALPSPIAWVAEEGGRVAGLCFGVIRATEAKGVRRSKRVAFLQDLAVLPECRGRGIATALVERARRQAAEAGAESLELYVWGFNRQAVNLYQKLGLTVQYSRLEQPLRREEA